MLETIPAALDAAAAAWPSKPAVVDGETTLTFAELRDRVAHTARAFMRAGLEAGDRVAIWGPNTWQWMVSALAVTYAGGTLVPLNSRYVATEVAAIVERTRARILVVHDGFLDRTQLQDLLDLPAVPGGRGPVPALPELTTVVRIGGRGTAATMAGVVDFERLDAGVDGSALAERVGAVGPEDVADILFTSGTTGRPKGAMSAHRQTVGVARAWAELGGVDSSDEYLVVNPFFHSFGYKIGIVVGLLTGATLHPMAAFDAAELMRIVDERRITLLPGAPTIYQSMLNDGSRSTYDLSSLRLAITGAAVVPVVLIERMRGELGIDTVVTAFGMTEAVVATMCRAGDSDDVVANTCGRAIDGMEVRIAGAEPGTSAAPGEEGELLLRGGYVMLGYLDDPAATAEAIDSDRWLHTGDVGRLDEQGNLKITDRLKDMYISGGFNVYPAEVEQALARLDGVADVAVVGVPDDRMGEVGKAYVVRGSGGASADLTADAVIAHARATMANFKAPRSVEFIDVLPRNLGGKVLKNELRDRA